jgi:hypothetical protein
MGRTPAAVKTVCALNDLDNFNAVKKEVHMAARVLPPTPEEIAIRARIIRMGWSHREKEKRRVYKTKLYFAPVADNIFTDRPNPRRLQKLY